MAGVPFWTDAIANPDPTVFGAPPDAWSVVYFGSDLQLMPGILENGDVSWRKHPHRVIDKGKKPASDGAAPKLLGVGVAEFDLKLIIWTKTQLNQLSALLPLIWPGKSSPVTITPNPQNSAAPGNGIPGAQFTLGLNLTQTTPGGGSPPKGQRDKPVLVYHPALTMAGITQVLLEGWTPPVRYGGKNDMKMYVIHCLEYRDAVAKQATTPKSLGNTKINSKTLPAQGPQTPPSVVNAGPGLSL